MRVDQDVQSGPEPDGVRVVTVDSRRERRHVMLRLLEVCVAPAEVGEADSQEVALDLVDRCRPEVVVLEIAMPVQEGLAIITALRGMASPPRIVVCSFHHDPVTVQAALDRGADAYVNKPVGSSELRAALGVPLAARSTLVST